MEELPILWEIGPLKLTPYGLILSLGTLLALLLTWRLSRSKRSVDAALWAVLGSLVFGHLTWALVRLDALLIDDEMGISALWRLHLGGYALYGAIPGAIAAVAIWSRVSGERFLPTLDDLAPGACLVIALGRLAEYYTGQGLGSVLEDEALQHFPLAICTYADEDFSIWQIPVFFYEAIAALILLAVLLRIRRKASQPGVVTAWFLTLLGVTQIFLEQLRKDEFLRFGGFVRFSQLAAIISIAVVMGIRMYREIRGDGWSLWQVLRLALYVLGTLVIIFVEFAFEKPNYYPWLSITLILDTLAAGAALLLIPQRRLISLRAALSGLLLAGAVVGSATLGQEYDWEIISLFLMMAVVLTGIGFAALGRKQETA